MSVSNNTLHWIEELASQEVLIRSGQKTFLDTSTTKQYVLSVETAAFMRRLHADFTTLLRYFNSKVEDSSLKVQLKRLNDKNESFELSRNQLFLIFDTSSAGIVQFRCEKQINSEGLDRLVSSQPRRTVLFSGVVEASFGVFDDIEWQFLGSRTGTEQISRHYLTEFIQMSR